MSTQTPKRQLTSAETRRLLELIFNPQTSSAPVATGAPVEREDRPVGHDTDQAGATPDGGAVRLLGSPARVADGEVAR